MEEIILCSPPQSVGNPAAWAIRHGATVYQWGDGRYYHARKLTTVDKSYISEPIHICSECGNKIKGDWGVGYHKMDCSNKIYLHDGDHWREWTKGVPYDKEKYDE